MKSNIFDDDLPPMGRIIDMGEEQIADILLRGLKGRGGMRLPPMSSRSRPPRYGVKDVFAAGLSARINHIDQRSAPGNGPEVIVRALGRPKTSRSARSLLAYVLRGPRDGQDGSEIQIFDHFSQALDREKAFAELAAWGLAGEDENLTPLARKLIAEGKDAEATALPPRERHLYNQAWHLVVSIVTDDMDRDAERLVKASEMAVDSLFTANDFSCLCVLHKDCPGRPHVHVIVKAQSLAGTRLRSDIHGDFLHAMRTEFARRLRAVGYDCRATRRMDRALEYGATGVDSDWGLPAQAMGERKRGGGSIQERAPLWFNAVGEQIPKWQDQSGAQRRGFVDALRGVKKPLPEISVESEASQIFESLYDAPELSKALWRRLAGEGAILESKNVVKAPNRSLAIWYLLHRPWTFGRLKARLPRDRVCRLRLRGYLKKLPIVRMPTVTRPLKLSRDAPPLNTAARQSRRRSVAREIIRLAAIDWFLFGNIFRARRLLSIASEVKTTPLSAGLKRPALSSPMPEEAEQNVSMPSTIAKPRPTQPRPRQLALKPSRKDRGMER